jgi:hypothetical protein
MHAQDDRATRQITQAAPVMTLSIQLRRAAISRLVLLQFASSDS